MQSPDTLIAIFNREGNQVGTKPRSQIDKHKDLLKTVNILVTNKENKILMIKAKNSAWPGKWGGSCATIVKDKESSHQAAERVLERELALKGNPQSLKESFQDFAGIERIHSVFHLQTSDTPKPNNQDFEHAAWYSLAEAQALIDKGACMPTFEAAFKELKATFK